MARLIVPFLVVVGVFFYICSPVAYAFIMGVGIHSKDFNKNPDDLIELMRKYKVKSFRTDLLWSEVEIIPGRYNFPDEKFKRLLEKSASTGMKSILILGYGNKNYEFFNRDNPMGKPTKDSTVNAFSNYAQWVAKNIEPTSVTFEIWNEWLQMAGEGNAVIALSDNSAKEYAKLVTASCHAIKKINPNITVIAGGISPLDIANIKWFEKVIGYGGMSCPDGISIHLYDFSSKNELNVQHSLNSIENFHDELIEKYSVNYKFYVTETGVPDGISANKSQEKTASYLNEFFGKAKEMSFIKGVWWYDFINDGSDPKNREHNFGLLNQDFKPKPAANKFKSISATD